MIGGPSDARSAPSPDVDGRPARILFVFLDGVGIGVHDAALNPFVRFADGLPTLVRMLGGRVPTIAEPRVAPSTRGGGHAFPLDASLGVAGTPQSGTGQVALLTGESAAEIFGGHFGPWTPVRLRPLLESRNLLKRAVDAGRTVAFANAYPRGWPGPRGTRGLAGPPLAARSAGVLTRHEEELAAGTAVSSEIVNDGWRRHLGFDAVPDVTAARAGANLARVSRHADLTLFAHYATDTAGHTHDMDAAGAALGRVDDFFAGVLAELPEDTLLVVASDHGNLEDVSAGHTRNPALGIAMGPGAERAAALTDLREVAPLLLELMGSGA
ncbi:MAG: alkaline phosphatase family protein [Gemmatimonadales bacterium]